MIYMLDTNVCVYIINKQPTTYCKRLERIWQKYTIAVSSIVLAELQYGVANSRRKEENQILVNILMSKLEVMDFPASAALYYGELRVYLKREGIMMGNNDLLIASHALCERAVVVTNNISEFKRVPGLVIENWSD
jgi:tRNA(fMet)-specific endonuclease VapC